MSKIDKTIILARQTNSKVLSMSADSADLVVKALSLVYQNVKEVIVSSAVDLDYIASLKPDLVFLDIKKTFLNSEKDSSEVWASDYFDSKNIKYTGSNSIAVKNDFYKELAKSKLLSVGIKTPSFFIQSSKKYQKLSDLPLKMPLFIKPPHLGDGTGIDDASVVRNFTDFINKTKQINSVFGSTWIAEEYLSGREFTVAIMERINGETLVMPVELLANKNKFGDMILTHETKSHDTERAIAVDDGVLRQEVCKLALDSFESLGGRDYGRIDIRCDASGKPNFIEANLLPGLGKGYFWRACSISKNFTKHSSVIERIAELGLKRLDPSINNS